MEHPYRKPKQQRSLDTLTKLKAAARELFTTVGYHRTQAKAISELAGLSIGSFYQYFPDKKAVYADLLEQMVCEFENLNIRHYLSPNLGQVGPLDEFLEKIEAWARGYGVLYMDLSSLAYQEDDLQVLSLQLRTRFVDIVSASISEALPGNSNGSVTRVAQMLFVLMDAILQEILAASDTGHRVEIRKEAALVLNSYLSQYIGTDFPSTRDPDGRGPHRIGGLKG